MNNKDRWSALSMQQRADLIKLYTDNGITNIKEIRKMMNRLIIKTRSSQMRASCFRYV